MITNTETRLLSSTTTTTTIPQQEPTRSLPPTTTGTSRTYIERCALAASYASQFDPLSIEFNLEKGSLSPSATPSQIRQALYEANITRLETMISESGSMVAESGDFAAVACWTPPHVLSSNSHPTEKELQDLYDSGRILFSQFLRSIQQAKLKHLFPRYGHNYWHLSLMARDPRVSYVAGAVRAVIEPFIQRAQQQQLAVWLHAGSEKARDVYGHFGFRVVEKVVVKGEIETWCMILEPDGISGQEDLGEVLRDQERELLDGARPMTG